MDDLATVFCVPLRLAYRATTQREWVKALLLQSEQYIAALFRPTGAFVPLTVVVQPGPLPELFSRHRAYPVREPTLQK